MAQDWNRRSVLGAGYGRVHVAGFGRKGANPDSGPVAVDHPRSALRRRRDHGRQGARRHGAWLAQLQGHSPMPVAFPVANRFQGGPAHRPHGWACATRCDLVRRRCRPHIQTYGQDEPAYSEDCLFLNVWTPALDGKKRPVMVYLHGGGYSTGSAGSTSQDGGRMAAVHDVVVVSPNHRLGPCWAFLWLGDAAGQRLRKLRQSGA